MLDGRYGSNSEVAPLERHFRFAPVNAHRQAALACPKSANNGSHSKQAMPSRATDRASPRLHFRADLRNQREGCPDDRDPSDRGVAPARRPEADRSRGAYRTRCCLRRYRHQHALWAETGRRGGRGAHPRHAILILRADNHGEGGMVALLALLDARRAPRGSWRASLLIVGLIGAALLYGDGVITPATSVLRAIDS